MNMWKVSTLLGVGIFAVSPVFLFAQTVASPEVVSAATSLATTTTPSFDFNKYRQEQLNSVNTMIDTWSALEKQAIDRKKIFERSVADGLEVITQPSNPKPGEQITVTVDSSLSNLNKANITWTLNGKQVLSGLGEIRFSFPNAQAGETAKLSIKIITNNGAVVTKNLSWSPAGVTLLWEAKTYTPPFYKGKPLITTESVVRAVAIPDIFGPKNTTLSAKNLVFLWKRNDEPDPTASGYAKDSFTFRAPEPYGDLNVSLQVSSLDDSIGSTMDFTPTISKPFILFYENHPLLGMWYNRPFGGTLKLSKEELSLAAEPYFFSRDPSPEIPELRYSWMINGKESQSVGRLLTLKNETGEEGRSSILLEMRGINKPSQKGSRDLVIDFQESAATSQTF